MSLKEAKERILEIEHAIRRLNSLKKFLNTNSSSVKAEIHSCITQNLECLRDREVSLLTQVDQTVRAKEETLQHQQARLIQALGDLKTSLRMVHEGTFPERHLADTLERLKRLELTAEETPLISFKADHMSVRECILNYGRVSGTGLPLMNAFDTPGSTSVSLPRHVEEYEDVDHHIFYKTVEDVNRAQTPTFRVKATVPKLSYRIEDWLQKKSPLVNVKTDVATAVKCQPATRPSTLTKPNDKFSAVVSSASTPGSSGSLNNWLSFIKQNVDLEEEHDFQIFDRSASQKGTPEGRSSATVVRSQQVCDNLKGWLSHDTGSSPGFSKTLLSHVSADTKVWLLQAYQQLDSLKDLKHKDLFQHISKDTSSWIHNAYSKQQMAEQERREEADFFKHISKDKDHWLQKQNKTNTLGKNNGAASCNDDKSCTSNNNCCMQTCKKQGEDKWLISGAAKSQSFQLEDICRANELCGNPSECVSRPDCFTLRFREKSAAKNVVDPAEAFKPLSLNLHEWLLPASQRSPSDVMVDKESNDMFHHIRGVGDAIWLMKATPSHEGVATPTKVKDNKEETSLWLQRMDSPKESDSSDSVKSCSTTFSHQSISDWLMVTDGDKEKHNECDKESDEWSVCTDTNVDQSVKDIAVADEYFSKWLL